MASRLFSLIFFGLILCCFSKATISKEEQKAPRFDEFTDVKFRDLDQDDLRTQSLNQAIGRLTAKGLLSQDKYEIAKTSPTEFSTKFNHPEFSPDEDILYNFTAEVNNTKGTGFEVYAIVISDYDTPTDYELIEYGAKEILRVVTPDPESDDDDDSDTGAEETDGDGDGHSGDDSKSASNVCVNFFYIIGIYIFVSLFLD